MVLIISILRDFVFICMCTACGCARVSVFVLRGLVFTLGVWDLSALMKTDKCDITLSKDH